MNLANWTRVTFAKCGVQKPVISPWFGLGFMLQKLRGNWNCWLIWWSCHKQVYFLTSQQWQANQKKLFGWDLNIRRNINFVAWTHFLLISMLATEAGYEGHWPCRGARWRVITLRLILCPPSTGDILRLSTDSLDRAQYCTPVQWCNALYTTLFRLTLRFRIL